MPNLFYAGQPDYIEKLNTLATAASMTNGTVAASFLSLAVTGTATAASFVGPLTGNASTATTLATARNINGVAFNGSADITVTAAAGTLTGTTLAANVVNASLNSITPAGGTLAVGGGQTLAGDLTFSGTRRINLPSGSEIDFGGPQDAVTGDGTAHTITIYTGNAVRGVFSNSGLAVTGTVSATGSLQAGAGGDGALSSVRSDNTSTIASGVNLSRGNATGTNVNISTTGDTANGVAAALLRFDGTEVMRWQPGNVAVTGSISATGTLFAGTAAAGNSHILQKDLNGDYSTIVKNTNAVNPLGLRILYEGIGSGNGNAFIGCQDNNGTRFVVGGNGSIFTANYIEGAEQTAPAAPAANGYRIFAQDNGAGKTQLMVIFGSGAAQQLAIEP